MANAGSFRKGEKRPNQGKHGPPKATLKAKEALAEFVDSNIDRLGMWLDEIHREEGAKAAFTCLTSLLEFHIPKRSREEISGPDGEPQKLIVSWKELDL